MAKSNYKVLIYDNRGGSYLNVAQCLAPYFDKCGYYSECRDAFPNPALSQIGAGFDEFERVNNFWSELDNWDIIVFPDGGFQDMADHLKKIGKLVFGGSHMYDIEEGRGLFHNLSQRAGLPTAPTVIVQGIKNLETALKTKKDKWIKISKWRGLIETYHWIDYKSSKFWIDELKHKLGPLGNLDVIEFVIQDPIDCIAEIGGDYYTLNGQLPSSQIVGLENKDCGYVGKVTKDIPEPIKYVNDKFAPILNSYNSSGFYSTEIRYTAQGEAYYTDAACRAGMPPSSSYLTNISNWNEIIPAIAKGEWVEPKYKSIYMVELILKSNYARDGYLPVTFPDEYKDNITFKGAMKVDGQVFIVPFSYSNIDMVEFGSVVVNDDNLDSAINKALEIASSIQAYEYRYELAAADIIKEDIQKMNDALDYNF